MSNQLNVVVPEQLERRLEETKEETGLSKSEIARRGILSELNELQGHDQLKLEDL